MKTKEKLAELQDLCQHYGMQDFVKDKIKLTDRQLID
jgi:thiamine monophosphate synthase